jgi:hypothetical protein
VLIVQPGRPGKKKPPDRDPGGAARLDSEAEITAGRNGSEGTQREAVVNPAGGPGCPAIGSPFGRHTPDPQENGMVCSIPGKTQKIPPIFHPIARRQQILTADLTDETD